MKIVYNSATGKGKQFAETLGYPTQSIKEPLDEPCLLVTRNAGVGKIPWHTKRFIKKYRPFIKGFVCMGDRQRFPHSFCGASSLLVQQYHIPHVRDVDGDGTAEDSAVVRQFLAAFTD